MNFYSQALVCEPDDYNPSTYILENIKPNFARELIFSKIRPCSLKAEQCLDELINEAQVTVKPRVAIKVCRVEAFGAEVHLQDITFESKLLNDNLAGHDQVFAYVATEGEESAHWARSLSGSKKALSWPIRYAALKLAEKEAVSFIKSNFGLTQLSSMHPGAVEFWPLEQQIPMFQLLSPLPEIIGVHLQKSLWMKPDLASTGVFFETQTRFYNCQLCSVNPCQHRKTAYLGLDGWPKRSGAANE